MEKGDKYRNYDADLFSFRSSQQAFEIMLAQTFRNPHSIHDTYIQSLCLFSFLKGLKIYLEEILD